MFLILFLVLFIAPVAMSATLYGLSDRAGNWWSADRSSAFEARLADERLDWRVIETPAAAGRPEPLHALYFIR